MFEIYIVTIIIFIAVNYSITIIFKDSCNINKINGYKNAKKFIVLFLISIVPVIRLLITISLIYCAVWADKAAENIDK